VEIFIQMETYMCYTRKSFQYLSVSSCYVYLLSQMGRAGRSRSLRLNRGGDNSKMR
jgi:hypothetical protein